MGSFLFHAVDNRAVPQFEVRPDARARAWLTSVPGRTWVIAYDVHRCCGGGKICRATVRDRKPADRPDDYVPVALDDGTSLLIDSRAARRLPSRFGLTVRGLGPLRHLDLELDGEQWGELLYT